jgi:CheY-like chemotaxis protein
MPMVLFSSVGAIAPPDADFAAVITKPIRSSSLEAAVAQVLRTERRTAAVVEVPATPATGRPPLRILLAEDNPVNQRVAQLMLAKLGHQVDSVPDGLAAVEAVQANTYDVVLMDVQMPRLDGLAATRRIRAKLPAQAQPAIIAMTASAMVEDQRACAEAGMESYLTKPVRIEDLRQTLDRVGATLGPPVTAGAAAAAAGAGSPSVRVLDGEVGAPDGAGQLRLLSRELELRGQLLRHVHPVGELEPDRPLARGLVGVHHVDGEAALVEDVGHREVPDVEGRRLEGGRRDHDVALRLQDVAHPLDRRPGLARGIDRERVVVLVREVARLVRAQAGEGGRHG